MHLLMRPARLALATAGGVASAFLLFGNSSSSRVHTPVMTEVHASTAAAEQPMAPSDSELGSWVHNVRVALDHSHVVLSSKQAAQLSTLELTASRSQRPVDSQSVISAQRVAQAIDHTLLRPTASTEEIVKLCTEARAHHFAAVCVNPVYVRLAAHELKSTPEIHVAAVVGFPLGASCTSVKAHEATTCIRDGAHEIDMVLNIGALKEGNLPLVLHDIEQVVKAARAASPKSIVKVIMETGYLSPREVVQACVLSVLAGADYVKTSTGFAAGVPAATPEVVTLMKRTVGELAKVKAAGGVRTTEAAVDMIRRGADRIGTSSGVSLVKGAATASTGY